MEDLNGEHSKPSKKSDMFALGMVIYQLVSHSVPYSDLTEETIKQYLIYLFNYLL